MNPNNNQANQQQANNALANNQLENQIGNNLTADTGQELPVAKKEDVEFSKELADQEDLEALERANQADARQEQE